VITALSIAGSDPTGGAGLQADLQVFRSLGVHGMGVLTALTVQDTTKVYSVLPVFPSVLLDQMRKLLRDIPPDAVKIGALGSDDVARHVDYGLNELDPARRTPIVLDPVLLASDGTPLLERRGWATLGDLCGRATLVTPNLPEAEALTGTDVSTREGIEAAAARFVTGFGAAAALVKGGHRDGTPDDLLAIREGGSASFHWLPGERVANADVHGTGCALSSAIAAHLARGVALREAVEAGRRFVHQAIRNARSRFLVYPEGNR
jgi:hydroxymethylpyrimidine/phosphomethylpyrimidine kinase